MAKNLTLTPKTAEPVAEKRGIPVYRENPSLTLKGGISTGRKRFHAPGGKGMMLVDNSTGEVHGVGGAGFWWEEEVDDTSFVKIYFDGIKQICGLSKTGMQVFEIVYRQMQDSPGKDKIEMSQFLANEMLGTNERTYRRGLRELLNKELLYRSTSDGVFFINIALMFNGNRLRFMRDVLRKGTSSRLTTADTTQERLALNAPEGENE